MRASKKAPLVMRISDRVGLLSGTAQRGQGAGGRGRRKSQPKERSSVRRISAPCPLPLAPFPAKRVSSSQARRTRRWPLFVLALVIVSATSCSPEPARTVIDGLGRKVAVPATIARIVTLAPNATELVAAAGGANRIVGTDDASDHPPAVRALPKLGALQPSIERIVALDPDVVVATTAGNPVSLVPALRSAGIPLYVLRTDRLADVPAGLAGLASLLDTDASEAIERMRRELAALDAGRAKVPRVLIILWPAPLYVVGRNTYLDDLLEATGAENAVTVDGWPSYSLEAIVAHPPDIILYPERAVAGEAVASLPEAAAGWRAVPAFETGAIHPIPDDLLLRPGPRLVEGARELERIFDAWERAR